MEADGCDTITRIIIIHSNIDLSQLSSASGYRTYAYHTGFHRRITGVSSDRPGQCIPLKTFNGIVTGCETRSANSVEPYPDTDKQSVLPVSERCHEVRVSVQLDGL